MCIEGECQTDEDCYNQYPWATGDAQCLNGKCVFNDQTCDDAHPCDAGMHCEMRCPAMPCEAGDPNCAPICDPAVDPNCTWTCTGICVPDVVPVCQADSDCPPGLICDAATGQCVQQALPCLTDAECPAGNVCVISCNGGAFCDPNKDPTCSLPCDPTTDPNCAPPECQGFCQPVGPIGCDDTMPCPAGFECIMECWTCDATTDPNCGCATGDPACTPTCKGYCVPVQPPECFSDQDCVAYGQIGQCFNGRCVYQEIPCDASGACPEGMECVTVCNGGPAPCDPAVDPTCVPCDPATDPNCSPICDPTVDPNCVGECKSLCMPVVQPECYSDADCWYSDGQMGHCVNGRCVFDQVYCSADWECPPGMACSVQECIPGCDPSTTDPNGGVACCVGVCVVVQTQCASDQDCLAPDGMMGRCINGVCVFDGGCACPDVWSPVCGTDGVTYSNACFAACAGVRVAYAGECEQNQTCLDDSQCLPGFYCEFCIGADGTGGPCTNVGVCLPRPELVCDSDQACPAGFQCIFDVCPEMPCTPEYCPPCLGKCVPVQNGCMITGCSGEVCAPFPVNTTCVWLPEYACLGLTTCEMLTTSDGQLTCGFVQNPEYLQCLENINGGGGCQADSDCAPGELCVFMCDETGGCKGTCMIQDCMCPDIYDPVCGADGVVYGNICELNCAGVELISFGNCDQTVP
jgi:hypothetical protein